MPSTTEQLLTATLALLDVAKSIDRKLTALVPPPAATDSDLDGPHGDPQVRTRVPSWKGDDMKGKPMSECPSEFLVMLGSLLDWQADQDDAKGETASNGKPRSVYKRLDAARARGWAKRKQHGWKPRPLEPSALGDLEDMPDDYDPFGGPDRGDIPF